MAFLGVGFSSDQTNLGKERLLYQFSWAQQYRCFFDSKYRVSANHWREGQMAMADAPGLRAWYLMRSTLRLWMRGLLTVKDIVKSIQYSLGRSS